MYKLLIVLLLLPLYSLGQIDARQQDIIPGTTNPRPVQTKKPKIKYELHNGTAFIKTGLIVNGKFKYTEPKGEVPIYEFYDDEYPEVKKRVALSMVKNIMLEGAEKGVSHRRDSTEFIWIDGYKDLYRKVRAGSIKLYDNSRIVNEEYDFINDYLLLAAKDGVGYQIITQLADLAPLMSDRPYFMASAKATNRYKTKDYRVIIYLVDLFNDKNAIDVLKWDKMELKLKNGKLIKGRGYVQPMDMRNEYIESSNAFVHIHDGKDFNLYNHHEISYVKIEGQKYEKGLYSVTNKTFYGIPWVYNGDNYMVVKRIVTNNNYYFRSKSKTGQDVVILKNVAGNYIRPVDELNIRQAWLAKQQEKQAVGGK